MNKDLPPIPGHPEPHIMVWSRLERETIEAYGQACARAAIEAQSEPSYTSRKLAEMVMSDCGHSTNNQRLLDRIAERIEKHTDSVRAALAAAPQPAQPAQPLSDERLCEAMRKAADELLDHIYELGTISEGVNPRLLAVGRAIEAAHNIKDQA